MYTNETDTKTIMNLIVNVIVVIFCMLTVAQVEIKTTELESSIQNISELSNNQKTETIYLFQPEDPCEQVDNKSVIDSYIFKVCLRYPNIDPTLVMSIVEHESGYIPSAVSSEGCVGLMQISPEWNADRMEKLGVYDLNDPYSNILVGVDCLNDLYIFTNSTELSLMMYSMDHSKAISLYNQGKVSNYAKSVIERQKAIASELEVYPNG